MCDTTSLRGRCGKGRLAVAVVIVVVAMVGYVAAVDIYRILFSPPRDHGWAACMNKLSSIGKAMFMQRENEEQPLTADSWEQEISRFLDDDENVFACHARKEGERFGGHHSYALNTSALLFDETDDADRIAVIESDHRLIKIEHNDRGQVVVRGRPVERHDSRVNALLFSGAVRSFELDEIMPDDADALRKYWLPAANKGDIQNVVVED